MIPPAGSVDVQRAVFFVYSLLNTDMPDARLPYIAFLNDLQLQLLFRLSNVPSGLLQPLFHIGDLLLELPAILDPIFRSRQHGVGGAVLPVHTLHQ